MLIRISSLAAAGVLLRFGGEYKGA